MNNQNQKVKKEKIDKRALVFNPIVYVERQLYRERNKYLAFKTLFVIINILILASTLGTAVVSALVLSGVVHEVVNGKDSIPSWFPLVAALVPAIAGFLAAVINFFVVKEKMNLAEKHYHKIQGEIILYASGDEKYEGVENKDFSLFDHVSRATGYKKGEING